MRIWLIAVLMMGIGCGSGCRKEPEAAAMPAALAMPAMPDRAQPRLQTIKVWVGAQELVTELALNDKARMTGMMFRTNMAANEAMLFVFPGPHRTSFWMKNTSLPLSAAYIDPDGAILELHDLDPHNTNSVMAASDRIQYVLETTQGWFKTNNIGPGAIVRTEKGSLRETFFRR